MSLFHVKKLISELILHLMSNRLDPFDLSILQHLQENARATPNEISEKVHLSPSAVRKRIKKMEQSGSIINYFTKLDLSKITNVVTYHTFIKLWSNANHVLTAFHEIVDQTSEIKECFHLNGRYDLMLHVVCKDVNEYSEFLANKINPLGCIQDITSCVVLDQWKPSNTKI